MQEVKVGIDVSAKTLDIAHTLDGERIQTLQCENTSAGHGKLIKLLVKQGRHVRVVIEATGTYSLGIALALSEHPRCAVMVANPLQVKGFSKASMQRAKTDKIDARMILKFNLMMPFIPWEPPSHDQLQLRGLTRRMSQLTQERTAEKNRRHSKEFEDEVLSAVVRQDIDENIAHLTGRIRVLQDRALLLVASDPKLQRVYDLLTSITGVGKISALQIMAELLILPEDMKASQWVAFAGLDPRVQESGTSVRKGKHISKAGNPYLRAGLYMPALTACKYDPHINAFYSKLVNGRGKNKKLALIAIMRKLLHAIWGMLRYDQPFIGEKFHPLPQGEHPPGTAPSIRA